MRPAKKVGNEADLSNFRIRYKSLEQTKQDLEGVMDINQYLDIDGDFSLSFAVR